MSTPTPTALDIFDRIQRAHNLARHHRTSAAIVLMQETLEAQSWDEPIRTELLSALLEFQLDSYALDDARSTLESLRPLHPTRATAEELRLCYGLGDLEKGLAKATILHDISNKLTPREQTRSYLAVGKLLTDSLRLEDARTWLVRALDQARHIADVDLIAACAGALAEVLYRVGAFREALQLLELDAALLPHGSVHADRLRVYRAHCYRQFGEIEAARSLYSESYQSARLSNADTSYAVRGLAWCAAIDVADALPIQAGITEIKDHIDEIAQTHHFGRAHSLAHSHLALAWVVAKLDGIEASKEHLETARTLFDQEGFQHEAQWCASAFEDTPPPQPLIAPQTTLSAAFAWLQDIPLEPLHPRWQRAREQFGNEPSPRSWMGLFF